MPPKPASRVTVIGAGVVGLTIACELSQHGHQVHLVADQDAADTVSGVAGALWYPYAIDSSPATLAQLIASLQKFEALAREPGTGVHLREGLLIEREPDSDHAWMQVITDHPAARPAELPDGATAGYRLTLPMIDTPRYLAWLARSAAASGVQRSRVTVHDLEQLTDGCDVVVVAAGLRSAHLLGDDDTSYPVRGQVVRLANPGLSSWVVDDENPAGMTYVFPRTDDIVCGGTADVGLDNTTADPGTEAAILRRCTALVPELAGLPVLSRGVGLRPARPSVRVEVLHRWSRPVVTCYGHGGAGVTASWGSAASVRDLIAAL